MVDPPVFTVQTEWSGETILPNSAWWHICQKHPEVRCYVEQIKTTLLHPNLVYETGFKKPTRAFYASGLISDNPRFRACWMCVFVRYEPDPSVVCTAYLPSRVKNHAKLLCAKK